MVRVRHNHQTRNGTICYEERLTAPHVGGEEHDVEFTDHKENDATCYTTQQRLVNKTFFFSYITTKTLPILVQAHIHSRFKVLELFLLSKFMCVHAIVNEGSIYLYFLVSSNLVNNSKVSGICFRI